MDKQNQTDACFHPNKPIIAEAAARRASARPDFPAPQIAVLFAALHAADLDPDLDPSAAAAVGLRQSSGAHAGDRDAVEEIRSSRNIYEINWQVIPNLTMDFIVPLLARVMNIYVAGQVFIVACSR